MSRPGRKNENPGEIQGFAASLVRSAGVLRWWRRRQQRGFRREPVYQYGGHLEAGGVPALEQLRRHVREPSSGNDGPPGHQDRREQLAAFLDQRVVSLVRRGGR